MAGLKIGEIAGYPVLIDDSLPPECMKMIGGGLATVFRIKNEAVEIVAQWPEGDDPPDLTLL